VRIDRSDLADELDDTHMARRARLAADDPGAAGTDRGKAVGGDDPPNSSPAPLDSSLCTERAAAYRAAVDAAYRQYTVDHGHARAEEPERETVVPAMRRIEAEYPERYLVALENRLKGRDRPAEAAELENLQVPDGTTSAAWVGLPPGEHDGRVRDRISDFYVVTQLASDDAYHSVAEIIPVLIRSANGTGYPTIGTAADDVQTGARGPASGREFDPEAAGGPIQQLDAGKARITNEGVHEAAAHLQRFAGGGPLGAPEQAMLDRLTSIAAGDMHPTSYDLNFYAHELDEAARYAQLGFGPESGVDLGSPTMYGVWNDVHTAALEDYSISGADLFYPGLAP
jgi:hypothetical protein